MAITAREIIIRAFYVLGKFSPETKPAEYEVQEGLYYLNDLLASFSANALLVPYQKTISFTLTPGKGVYVFSNKDSADVQADKIVSLISASITRGNIAYPINVVAPEQLQTSVRFLEQRSIPQYISLQNSADLSTIELYPLPYDANTCTLVAKFTIDDLEMDDRLDELPPYYFRFLRYALAKELAGVYETANWDANKESIYQELERTVIASNNIDLAVRVNQRAFRPFWGPSGAS